MISKCYLIEPFTCKETSQLKEVAQKLKEYKQRHIYVVNAEEKPIGIISVTDILDTIIEGKNAAEMTAKDIMIPEILVFDDNDNVKDAYKAMNEKGVVSCAIIDKDKADSKMVGILTLKEALRFLTDPANIA